MLIVGAQTILHTLSLGLDTVYAKSTEYINIQALDKNINPKRKLM